MNLYTYSYYMFSFLSVDLTMFTLGPQKCYLGKLFLKSNYSILLICKVRIFQMVLPNPQVFIWTAGIFPFETWVVWRWEGAGVPLLCLSRLGTSQDCSGLDFIKCSVW